MESKWTGRVIILGMVLIGVIIILSLFNKLTPLLVDGILGLYGIFALNNFGKHWLYRDANVSQQNIKPSRSIWDGPPAE